MKKSRLLIMVIAAAILVGLAFWSGQSRRPRKPQQIGKPVLADLPINDIRRIEISQAGKSVVLANSGDGWVATSLFNYPADFGKIRDNLLTLRDLTVGDVQRGTQLDPITTTLVDLQDATGKSLATLRLGDVRNKPENEQGWSAPDGRAVAANADDTVCLVKDPLSAFEPDVKTWIDSEIANLSSTEIATITFASADGTFTLDRTSGSLTLEDLAADETFDTSKSYGAESALSYLRLADLADPTLNDEQTGIATGHTYTVTTQAGEIYTAHIGNAAPGGSDRYFRLAVSAAPVSTNVAERATITQKANALNAKVSPWLYLISSWSADNMTRSRAHFIKPVEPVKPDEPVETAATVVTDETAEKKESPTTETPVTATVADDTE